MKKKVTKNVTNASRKNNLIENKNYSKLLEIVGLSQKPISSYEIQKEFTRLYKNIELDKKIADSKKARKTKWGMKHNQYIFKMIKNLRPDLVEDFYTNFFNWDEIINDESQKKRVVNYIKEKFKIDLKISGNSFEEKDILPLFIKSRNDKIINIENQAKHIQVSIQKTRYNNAEIILIENNEKKILSLNVKNNTEVYVPITSFDEPFANFMNAFYRKRPFFLDVNYATKIKKREVNNNQISRNSYTDSAQLNYENETIDVTSENGYTIRKPLKDYISKEMYEIRQNLSKSQHKTKVERMEKYLEIEKYFLNIRGLILYILGKITPNKNEDKNPPIQKESSKEKYRKNISVVLSNLSENYSSNFPFLLYYTRFKEIFKDVMKNHQYLRYYDVDILITIAKELESQIWLDDKYSSLNVDSNNNALIKYWIIQRYSAEVTHFLAYFSKYLKEDDKEKFFSIFREYQK